MKIKEIQYLNFNTPHELIEYALDILVTLETDNDIEKCLVKATTLQYLFIIMEREKSYFVPVMYPHIIVSILTDEVIEAATLADVNKYDDAYWLKFYSITPNLNIEDLNEILSRKAKESRELSAQIEEEFGKKSKMNS